MLALADYKDDAVPTHHCGTMDVKCKHCMALNFALELVGKPPHFNLCCQAGKAKLVPKTQRPPPVLLDLLTDLSKTGKKFRERIKDYNAAFCMVSFGDDNFPQVKGGRGPPIVQCHGIAYHRAGQLFPDDPNNAQYAQLYLYDPDFSLAARQGQHKELDPKVLASLQGMMDEESSYVREYRSMADVLRENPAPKVTLKFAAAEELDLRRYNKPQTRDPAVVFTSIDGAPQPNRDIVIWPHDQPMHRISELTEHVDPSAYPLLFLYGDIG